MAFSSQWDERYRSGTHLSRWPWSDLVSLVMRHANPREHPRVLELGCGAGANIPFFLRLGFDYRGIEGSPYMVEDLRRSFPQIASHLHVGDFTRAIPEHGPTQADRNQSRGQTADRKGTTREGAAGRGFDLVVDRAALTHNSEEDIRRCLDLVWDALRPGGKFIGVDWFADSHDEARGGNPGRDPRTRSDYATGPFAGVGRVHFSDRTHVEDLFARFTLVHLELKTSRLLLPEKWTQAMWNIIAVKPEDTTGGA